MGLDESIYANVALAAARDGHWFPALFEGQPFFEKPPLGMGLQALSMLLFGIGEWSVRLPSALAGAGCVYFTWRLAARIGKSEAAGFFAAALMGLSEHFILFSRVATLDMMLTLCLLGSWWELLKAYDPDDRSSRHQQHKYEDRRDAESQRNTFSLFDFLYSIFRSPLGRAGLWVAAGLLVKSFFALLFVIPALVAFHWSRTNPIPLRTLLVRLGIPSLLALAIWFPLYGVVYGKPFFEWELGSNVAFRLVTGAVGRIFRTADVEFHSWQLYVEIAKNGLAFLWPLLPLGLAIWGNAAREGRRERKADPFLLSGLFILLVWMFLIVVLMRPLINYLLPLVPLIAIALAAIGRAIPTLPTGLLVAAAGLLGFWNGMNRHAHPLAVFLIAAVLGFLVLRVRNDKPHSWGKRLILMSAVLLLAGSAWKLRTYLPHPPDPIAKWVEAVKQNPAREKGQFLLFYGDPVEGRVLRFYSDYQVRPMKETPIPRPKEAMLFEYNGTVHFLPAMNGN